MGNQFGRPPGLGGMAKLTLQTKKAGMDRGFLMAGVAGSRDAAKTLAGMAVFALDLGMLAFQGKKTGVIEGVQPVFAIVAGDTGGSILGLVLLHEYRIVVGMARVAGLGVEWLVSRSLKLTRMAAGAVDRSALPVFGMQRQAETGIAMLEGLAVEAGGFPGGTGMAGNAVGAEQSGMLFGLGMARNTGGWDFSIISTFVAVIAGYLPVFARQWEMGLVMVE